MIRLFVAMIRLAVTISLVIRASSLP